jgi:SWI/SNF-related matrix-associated actin-dependent regulator 1 of chromatin subfamily A
MIGITLDMANTIISFRPFVDFDDLTTKLGQGRRKNGPGGISPRLVADTERIMLGYAKVDSILAECEKTGKHLRNILDSWINVGVDAEKLGDTGVGLTRMASLKQEKIKGYISRQPNLAEGVQLKEYQLLGLNWLNLLHTKGHSCILADEMGLSIWYEV